MVRIYSILFMACTYLTGCSTPTETKKADTSSQTFLSDCYFVNYISPSIFYSAKKNIANEKSRAKALPSTPHVRTILLDHLENIDKYSAGHVFSNDIFHTCASPFVEIKKSQSLKCQQVSFLSTILSKELEKNSSREELAQAFYELQNKNIIFPTDSNNSEFIIDVLYNTNKSSNKSIVHYNISYELFYTCIKENW